MAKGISRAAAAVGLVALSYGLQGCSGEQGGDASAAGVAGEQQAVRGPASASAVLRDANGAFVGRVLFVSRDPTAVFVSARLPGGTDGIHGFHVHANDNPANGEGCIADPAEPASAHFISADGHYNPGAGAHGDHAGDMPALFFTAGGYASMSFVTDHFAPDELVGKAVILHAAPDNYGNVPVGAEANQYTPNSAAATTLTQNTGNAGNRIACGVIGR